MNNENYLIVHLKNGNLGQQIQDIEYKCKQFGINTKMFSVLDDKRLVVQVCGTNNDVKKIC